MRKKTRMMEKQENLESKQWICWPGKKLFSASLVFFWPGKTLEFHQLPVSRESQLVSRDNNDRKGGKYICFFPNLKIDVWKRRIFALPNLILLWKAGSFFVAKFEVSFPLLWPILTINPLISLPRVKFTQKVSKYSYQFVFQKWQWSSGFRILSLTVCDWEPMIMMAMVNDKSIN